MDNFYLLLNATCSQTVIYSISAIRFLSFLLVSLGRPTIITIMISPHMVLVQSS